ncbi:metallophosphoesterase family protein [Paenibacillus beijingensis]|uniref:Phosphoesterase n=1 Tax=Paenibacillus beijingensis TaxID=1126833 RepID=A0A0D5NN25_9BACL|nr:metallophosphoesterase family protein [Paenibacillus beijingensis]AJY76699.1 phosphodiesterase [Paenibacillus beijingensis]
MKVGIVSDTHMPRKSKELPKSLMKGFRDVELIIHCGDWTTGEVVKALESIAPVEGVTGNGDSKEIEERFGWSKIIRAGGLAIGIVHGHLGIGASTPQRAWNTFRGQAVDLIVFGHSHIPFKESREGVMLLNPGSPTDKRRQRLFSYGILEVGDGVWDVNHLFFSTKIKT